MIIEIIIFQTGTLKAFKWGIGKLIESSKYLIPWVVPIYISG